MDLIAIAAVPVYIHGVQGETFRQRIGNQLLLLREQKKHWSRRAAAKAIEADSGTIRAMEQGRNSGWDFFERYAQALDTSLERICREVLAMPTANTVSLTPEEEVILSAYRAGGVGQRSLILQAARAFAVEHREVPAPPAAQSADAPASTDGSRARTRKSRGR